MLSLGARQPRAKSGGAGRSPAPRCWPSRVRGSQARQGQQQQAAFSSFLKQRPGLRHVCRATIDEPEIQELVQQLREQTPDPPAERPKLEKAISIIDAANAEDPTRMPVDGESVPYRLAYSRWLTEWVKRIDPKASDELLILARGRNIQSWRLADIKRDDYAPNTPGQRQWEVDRKKWLAERLLEVVREAGYGEASQSLIEDVMMGRNAPDPRDIRKYDLVGALGMVDFNKLRAGIVTVLKQKWSPVQQRLLQKVLPVPFTYNDIMMDVEGVAAASTHPGDWRYANFDYD